MTSASQKGVDVAALSKLIGGFKLELEALRRENELLRESAMQTQALLRENKILREELALLKQWRFGRSSERMEFGQLELFEAGVPQGLPEPTTTAPTKPKKRPGHGRAPFPEHLPRNTSVLELSESERTCDCGAVMAEIGVDVTERGRLIPARFVVDRFEKKKYACPHGHAVKTASTPEGVIDGAKYDATVYAHVAVAKYQDHLPLNRLEGIFKRSGLKLAKQTMWDMLVTVDELVAQPVLKQMREELLCERILHADETPVKLRLEDGKGSKDSWVWGYRSLRGIEQPKALVDFRMGRGGDGPKSFLGKWPTSPAGRRGPWCPSVPPAPPRSEACCGKKESVK